MQQIHYDTTDVPTIKEFLESRAFIRGLMGPFGCIVNETEYLTPSGWKRIDAYCPGDRLAVWSPTGETFFEAPEAYINEPCDGFLLFNSGSLKMALSPEHRVPHLNWRGEFRVSTAAEIAIRPSRRVIPTTFRAPGRGIDLSDNMIRFAVMMHADGHYPPEGRRAVIEVHKDRKKERIRQVLSALNIEWREFLREDRPASVRFTFEPPYTGKHFDGDWWAMNERQLGIVLDEIEHWDGLHDHAESVFTTNHKADADFIQFAAHATGHRASLHMQVHPNPNWRPTWFVRIRTTDKGKNRVAISAHTAIERLEPPDGRKYCFTTSTGFFVARYRDTVFITGNSGKSSGCIWDIIYKSLQQKPGPDGVRRTRWAVIRNTYRMLNDTTIRTVHQWFPYPTCGRWRATDHEYVIDTMVSGNETVAVQIELLFRALDRPDHVRNLLSLDLTGGWINEAREVPWAIIEALQGRVDRFPPKRHGGATWAGIIMDTNPPDSDSQWYKFFEEADHTEAVAALATYMPGLTVDTYARIFKQPSGLSPQAENARNQSPGYWHRLAIGKSPEWIKVYVQGDYGFVVDGRPVFPEYHDAVHCPGSEDPKRAPVTDPRLPIYRGWDFGLTPACVYSQLSARGQWKVVDEQVSTSMGIDRFSDQVLSHSARFYPDSEFVDVGDPAGEARAETDERSCYDILHSKGILIEAGLQTPIMRFESVRRPLRQMDDDGHPAFNIHPRCVQTRKGMMGGYHFRKIQIAGTDRYAEKPEKNASSHPVEAMCYTATRLFGSALQFQGFGLDSDIVERNSRLVTDMTRDRVTGY